MLGGYIPLRRVNNVVMLIVLIVPLPCHEAVTAVSAKASLKSC